MFAENRIKCGSAPFPFPKQDLYDFLGRLWDGPYFLFLFQ